MISSEKDVYKLAKKFALIKDDGTIYEDAFPNPDEFPELLGKYGEKETFIRRWSEYAKEYNRKLKNKRRVEEIRVAHEKKRHVSRGNKSTYSSYKKGTTISRPSYGKW